MSSDESHTFASEGHEFESSDVWKEKFCDILNNVRNPGKFCVSKRLIFPNMHPKIVVAGLDERIAFPLSRFQAESLRSVAEKAPFGKGMETVLDENVRRAWQIDAAMITFEDELAWKSELSKIVNQMRMNLGIHRQDVKANLYKMLLYETGGHFMPHRDTEKEPGMFATLIVQLPSKFEGGDLVVCHNGEKKTIKNSENCQDEFRVTAFYADCEHTLQKITSGFRLCLVYNLVISFQQNLPNELPCAATINATVEKLRKLADSWNDCLEEPYVGYLLEHKYTEQNLGFHLLKGKDKHVIDMLRSAENSNGQSLFIVVLVLIEKRVSGTPEGRGGYYSDDSGPHCMDDIHETDVGVNCWLGPDGSKMNNFQIDVDVANDLVNVENEDDIFGDEPDDEEYEGYTGNAGPTLEQWYYRAAVMFWPRSKNLEMVGLGGLPYLASYLSQAEEPELSILAQKAIKMLNKTNSSPSETLLDGLLRSGKPQLVASGLKSSEVASANYSTLRNIALKMGDVAEVKKALLNLVSQSVESELKTSPYSYYSNPSLHTLTFADSLKGVCDELYNEMHALIISKALSHDSLFKNGGKCVKIALSAFSLPEQFSLFIDRALTSADESLSSKILEALSSVPGVTINGDVRRLAESKISKLRTSVAEGSPKFSWCQTSATFQGSQADAVNAFLRSDEMEKTFTGFNGINHARNWASKYFNWNMESYSVNATPGGIGRKAFVKLTKTRGAYDKAVAKYEKNLSELRKWEKMFNSADSASTEDLDENRNACAPDPKRMKFN